MPLIYVTGGTRSGKSTFAQQQAEARPGELLYVATAAIGDGEMAERVALHQAARGERWTTLEEEYDLAERIPAAAVGKSAVLIDCLTLWLSNGYFRHQEEAAPCLAAGERMLQALAAMELPVYLVSNEIGFGVVPENRMARHFRDLAGELNQRAAALAEEAWLVVSGIPLRLK